MKAGIRMIASDYDGTLRYLDEVTQEDLEAVERWKKAGNLFVIDTGRSMESMSQEAAKCGLRADYYVTNNGGMVYDRDRNEMFATRIDPVMAVDIMYIAHEIGNVVSYVANDGYYRHRIVIDPLLTEMRYPALEPDMSEEELMRLGKYAQIVISMDTEENASALAARINSHFPDLVAAYANRYVTDIVPAGVSKATGLMQLCSLTGIDPDNVYTIGDADNDIPLIRFGSHGACIKDAPDEIRKHAKKTYACMKEMIEDILKQ
ncbi:MAG: HAD family hydrolase [Solobacterium sp.]|nr:HAD family hydrolase [Solobacterium sp.]